MKQFIMPSADSNIYEYINISHYMCGVFSFGLLIQLYTCIHLVVHVHMSYSRTILIDIIHVTADLF